MTALTAKSKRFRKGESIFNFLDAEYLNDLEIRLKRLEEAYHAPPLRAEKTTAGISVSIDKKILNYEFVKLAPNGTPGPDGQIKKDNKNRECNELDPFEDAVAYVMGMSPVVKLSTFPYIHVDRQEAIDGDNEHQASNGKYTIWVVDVFGISSQPGTYGIAFEHPRSEIKRWIFLPSPIGGGENIPNYSYTKHQALCHSGAGDKGEGVIVQWVDIDDCDAGAGI